MPGLGDALGRAMEQGRHDISDVVRRAAEGEPAGGEAEPEAKAAASPAGAGGRAGVSPSEKDSLLGAGGPSSAAPAGGAAPAAPQRTEIVPRSAEGPGTRPTVRAQTPPVAPAVPPGPDIASEPIAPFAPSGVIRRKLVRTAEADAVLLSAGPARPLTELLAGCRQVPSLPAAAVYRTPVLARSVDRAVRTVMKGDLGRPAFLVICGATAHAGTSTVAAVLGLALADRGSLRVLLVDADGRSPGLAALAEAAGTGPGFTDVLVGGCELPSAIVLSVAEKVALLSAGGGAAAALARLASGPELGRFLDRTKTIFDVVIFDAGSVPDSPAAAELAAGAGTALLVARSGRTTTGEVRAAKEKLRHAGARVAGAVLTFAAAKG